MITSTANQHVKWLRALVESSRHRRRERSFVLEGVRLVTDALAAGAELRLALYAPDQLATTEAGVALLDRLRSLPHCFPATPAAIAAAADTEQPQGIIAAVTWPMLPPRPGLRLVLDEIQDPGNVGTLLRSAAAAGVGCVICAPGTADPFSPKVARAAMGAHFLLPLRLMGWEEIAVELADYTVYAADSAGQQPYYAVDWRQPAALIIGNEAHGLGAAARALAHRLIAIPMIGSIESLNAGVAGSIILFEALRQRTVGQS
ncbi:TrmH family RNA methyltransferase [Chloroflexus sp.]|uniref:TrmH family RNA methyltransferase n=1 Tax=Chloroflexus sp. TaxID=1904827 RepID=UPI0026043E9B|nr:RNA methyltransferase [uncultured Chloroflexus sp.]